MSSFDKSAVEVASLSVGELSRVSEALVGKEATDCWQLSNGACAANYGVYFDEDKVVVKAVVGADSGTLAVNLLSVLKQLEGTGVAPAPRSDVVVPCATHDGRKACAVAMSLVPGKPANELVRRDGVPAVEAYGEIGTTLGKLHSSSSSPGVVALQDDEGASSGASSANQANVKNDVADPRYLETFVRVVSLEETLRRDCDDVFGEWATARLDGARRALGRRDLPRGLLHGDPYADNHVLVWDSDKKAVTRATLVDWEDVAVGPFAYDLACALVACAFPVVVEKKESDSTFSADLDADVAAAVLRNYASQRPAFSRDEATALTDLMLANVLACATYRWHQFNVVDPKSPPPAKESYREMLAIAKAIEHDDRIASLAATYCA